MWENLINNITPIIIGAICTPIGAWIGSVLERRKYMSGVVKTELDNVREANDILMNTIVIPLREEVKTLRNDLDRLNKALERIPSCPYSHSCPITSQLRSEAKQRKEDKSRVKDVEYEDDG